MTFRNFSVGSGLLALAMFISMGCKPQPANKATSGATGTASTGEHAHEHEEHGAHGGHMLHLEPDGAHAEWTHDDTTKVVTVFLDELAAPPQEVKFVVKAGDTEPQTFPLVKAEGGSGGGVWTLNSDALLTHLAMGDAAQVQLIVVSDGKEMSTKIEHSDEHDHHH